MLQTLERNVHTFDAQVLTPAGAAALAELTGPAGLPFLPPDRQRTALENGQIIADYAGQPELQAAAALMPLYDDAPLPTSLRAAGYGADGQGAVLTPPVLNENYTQLRHFLRMALRWATERYASYHVWAVLPLDLEHPEACDDLCAQYLSAGLTLRGMRPMAGADQMLIFSAHGLVKWRDPLRRCHLADPALPRVLERGYAAADFGWGKNGLALVQEPGLVGVHDGVRPFVSVEVIRRCYELAEVQKAVIPVVDVVETLRHLTDAGSETVSRIDYKLVQTPQVFDVELLQQAYAQEFTPFFTDDASVVEAMGMPVYLAEGNRENIKITTPFDLKVGSALL